MRFQMPTSTRLDFPGCWRDLAQSDRTAVCGPACMVVWQGRRGDSPPYADLLAGGFERQASHYFKGESSRDGGGGTAHFHADFNGLNQLLEAGAGDGGLLDVPLHAGLAILDDGDAEADEFLVLLGHGAIGVGRPLHGNEAVVDLGGVRSE